MENSPKSPSKKEEKRKEEIRMTSVDCLLLHDSNDFRLLDYSIACVNHYDDLLNESNITDDVVLSYAKDIMINEGLSYTMLSITHPSLQISLFQLTY